MNQHQRKKEMNNEFFQLHITNRLAKKHLEQKRKNVNFLMKIGFYSL